MHIYIDDKSNPMKEFQLPADFMPELSRTNPFLTDEGSQSVPLTLPASNHNMALLGFSYRTTPTNRPAQKLKVILSDQNVWMRGTLFIEKSNKKEGIDCTLYINEGEINEKIKDHKLKDLKWPKYEGIGDNLIAKTRYWMRSFTSIMGEKENSNPDYYIFSVTTDYVFVTDSSRQFNDTLILNETIIPSGPIEYVAMKERKYKDGYGESATEYTVPMGYGVTPFLRISYMLRHIFSFFGYTLQSNIFDTDISLSRLCLINNTADAIVAGNLDYSQLMPENLSVEDFLSTIRKKYAIEFVESNGFVSVITWNQVLEDKPDQDLSAYIREDPSWTNEDKKSLQIEYQPTGEMDEYYITYKTLKHNAVPKTKSEDIKTNDKTPFHELSYISYYKLNFTAPYIGGITHKNSDLVVSGNIEDEDNEELEIIFCFSIPGEQRLKFDDTYRYYAGTIWSYDNQDEIWGTLSLVINEITEDVNPTIKAKDNIYNKMYKKRDEMLQYANQLIVYKALLPSNIVANINITKSKIINGQKVLIERIDYVFGQTELMQITTHTLHQFKE